jgi:amino acid transporter
MSSPVELRREIGVWRGVALNMIDMVGIGPFITIPLILSALGGGRAMLAWLLGALLAISDGLVTAELSAELPAAGGSYIFLREAFGPERLGRLISFLFLFQVVFSAPLSMASGSIGFAQYLAYLFPAVGGHVPIVAAAVCAATVALLFRRIGSVGKLSLLFWAGVMATLAIVIGAGLPHLRLAAFEFWKAPRSGPGRGWSGLDVAVLFAVYDYLGYYNICYIGGEIKDPTRTIPRVIVISILLIAAIYILMNGCLISVLPMEKAMTSRSVVADYLQVLIGPRAARIATVLILWTAFASVFSLVLGYSRILYAAARDGNFFSIFGRLHPTGAYPYAALGALGAVGALFCLLPLPTVIKSIISIRAIIPFMAQIVGAVILRRRRPAAARPFRMWLYPVPVIFALGLWSYIAFSPQKGIRLAGVYIMSAGAVFYLLRSLFLREWPFRPARTDA